MMHDDVTDELGQNVPLVEMIESVRRELAAAIEQGRGQAVQFEVGGAELEFEVVAKRTSEGNGQIKFWVVTAGGKATAEDGLRHRFKLSLVPRTADGQPLKVSR